MTAAREYTTGEVIEILIKECGLTHKEAKQLIREYQLQTAEDDLADNGALS